MPSTRYSTRNTATGSRATARGVGFFSINSLLYENVGFFTAFDGIMRGRKSQRKDICTLSALSGASDLYAGVFGETGAGRCLHHGWLAYLADDVSPSIDRSPFFPEINVGLLAGPWFEDRMAQCLTAILGGRATAAAMVTLAAYLAVTLLVQGARFVKRFYVRRLTNNGAINFNGYTITLADGTVLR